MAKPALPDTSKVKIPGDSGSKDVDPTVDVIRRNSPWAGKYSALSEFPEPYALQGRPWIIPDEMKWIMLKDPQVFAGYMLWKTATLVDGIQIYPSKNIKDSNGKKSKLREKYAREISELCTWNFNNMSGSFHNKMLQLLDCCIWGHKAAVQIHRLQEKGRWKDKLVLDSLRILPNCDYKIRTDEFGKVIGLQPIGDSGDNNILSLRKFMFAVFRPYDDHPFGTNLLWPCYTAWYEKQQIAPERLANMAQFGSPSLYAVAPEGVKTVEVLDQYGMPLKYPQFLEDGVTAHPRAGQVVQLPINRHILDSLRNFQGNGSVTVIPNTAELHKIEASNGEGIFRLYSEDKNLEIIKSMFFTTGWTEQEKFSSNAKGKVAESIGQFSVMDGKNMLSDLCADSLCSNIVLLNYGPEYMDLIPEVTFGNAERSMLASLYNAIAALWSTGFFDDSQRAQLCQRLALPEPDPNATRPQQGQPTGNVIVNNKDQNNTDQQQQDNQDQNN